MQYTSSRIYQRFIYPLSTKCRNVLKGILCHSLIKAARKSCTFRKAWTLLIFLPILSHTCSLGFISVDMDGLWIVSIASWRIESETKHDMCGLTLSFMNIRLAARLWLSKYGTTISRMRCILINEQKQMTIYYVVKIINNDSTHNLYNKQYVYDFCLIGI